MQQSAVTYNFNDPCWLKAGQYTQQLIDAEPFQDGFLATPAQQGATSSAGLVANGKAAMELQGHWNPGVMQPLTPGQEDPELPRLVPVPERARRQGAARRRCSAAATASRARGRRRSRRARSS